jgi:hypothetical protein
MHYNCAKQIVYSRKKMSTLKSRKINYNLCQAGSLALKRLEKVLSKSMSTYNQKEGLQLCQAAAYSIKKTTKKALFSNSMFTYKQKDKLQIVPSNATLNEYSSWCVEPQEAVRLDRKLNDYTSIFWTLMGVSMPQRLTVLLDRKLNDYSSNFWSLMGGGGE